MADLKVQEFVSGKLLNSKIDHMMFAIYGIIHCLLADHKCIRMHQDLREYVQKWLEQSTINVKIYRYSQKHRFGLEISEILEKKGFLAVSFQKWKASSLSEKLFWNCNIAPNIWKQTSV